MTFPDNPVALIAAQAENRVIGRGLEIPWKAKGEQALFKEITRGGTLIMGRKTYDSIGRPLPGRETIVVTGNPTFSAEGCHTASGLAEALEAAHRLGKPIFIAGGGELYRQALDLADAVHLTTIHTKVDGDVYFPVLPDDFHLVREERFSTNLDYTYRYFERGDTAT